MVVFGIEGIRKSVNMNPDRWQQITEAFHVALDRDTAARAAYLDEACAGDPALREEVDAMIAAHLKAGSFGRQPLGVPPGLNQRRQPRPVFALRLPSPRGTRPSRHVSSMPPWPRPAGAGRVLRPLSSRSHHRRSLSGARSARSRRHGRCVQGVRSQAARPCCPQGHPRRPRCQRTSPRVSARRSAIGA